jgi:hypothetical protein
MTENATFLGFLADVDLEVWAFSYRLSFTVFGTSVEISTKNRIGITVDGAIAFIEVTFKPLFFSPFTITFYQVRNSGKFLTFQVKYQNWPH